MAKAWDGPFRRGPSGGIFRPPGQRLLAIRKKRYLSPHRHAELFDETDSWTREVIVVVVVVPNQP